MIFNKDELKNYGSCFSGIGGFEFGIEQVIPEADCKFYSEIEPFAIKSYEILLPEHKGKGLGDITKINKKELPLIDFLVGGFPCQPFSIAGNQLGFADTRGTLFRELIDISIEKKPKLLFFENVKALVSHDDYKTLQVILKEMNNAGYYINYSVINSRYHNVPHNRERVFILGVRNDLVNKSEWNKIDKPNTILGKSYLLAEKNNIEIFDFNWPENNEEVLLTNIEDVDCTHFFTESRTKRMLDGNTEMHLTLLNDLKENETKFIRFTKEQVVSYALVANCITARDYKGPSKQQMTGIAKKVDGKIQLRQLNEVECYRLQGYTNEQIQLLKENKISRSQMIKQAGNAVTINVIASIMKSLIK